MWSICNVSFKSTFHSALFSDKYPSEEVCSINVRPNERLLGSNVCSFPPDTVEASCQMSFRDDSNLDPYLEWTVDGRIIHANERTVDGNTTASRVRFSASDLQSSSQLVCRVKYRSNSDIEANLTWSKLINVTSKRL